TAGYSECVFCSGTVFKRVGASSEGEDAKPTLNPSNPVTVQQQESIPTYHALFQAYPSQRPRRKTRNNPYLRPEEPEVATPAGNMNPDVEDNDVEIVSMDNIVPTMPVVPEQVASIHQEATPEKEPEKPVVKTATVAQLKKSHSKEKDNSKELTVYCSAFTTI